MSKIELCTDRLLMIPLSLNYIDDIAQWETDPKVTRFLSYDAFESIDDLVEHVRTLINRMSISDYYIWLIVSKESNKAIGQIAVHPGEEAHKYVLGYQLNINAWNKGYITEAAKAVLHYIFLNTEIDYVYATYDSENPASGAVMEHCGMTFLSKRTHCNIKSTLQDRTMIRYYITREIYMNGTPQYRSTNKSTRQ